MKEVLFAQTSCVILSAGSSVRMGTPKALLKFDSEKTFIQKITETYLMAGIEQVIVVVNVELEKLIRTSHNVLPGKVFLVTNHKPELGRFYSLQTGSKLIPSGNSCFFQNIDNPFTTIEILNALILHKQEAEVIKPVFRNKSGHPVLISPLVVQKIHESREYEIRIDAFLRQCTTREVEVKDHRVSVNINSQKAYLDAGFGN